MIQAPLRLIGVRHLSAGGAHVPVLLFKNDGGSVAGRLLIGEGDEPILDGASVQAVLEVTGTILACALLARGRRVA